MAMHYAENELFAISYKGSKSLCYSSHFNRWIFRHRFYYGFSEQRNINDFVRGSLIPEMLPFDGINSKSIAIIDNNIACTRSVGSVH